MAALRDPKREKFAQALARLQAEGMDRTAACVKAGIEAEYPNPASRSFAPNCRKRANRPDVKARIAELLAPGIERAAKEVEATVEWGISRLKTIADFDVLPKASDVIAAIALIAKISDWPMAAQRHEHSGPNGEPITTADVTDEMRAHALANFIARTRATLRPEADAAA